MVNGNEIHIRGVIGEDYGYADFLSDLSELNINNRKYINIYIDSPGGYVDEAKLIYDKLKSLKDNYDIRMYNDGDVMSCASMLFTLGDERTFDFGKGNIVIHNPYTQIEGDAATLRQYAKELQSTEDGLTQIYSNLSKTNPAEISAIMDENRILTADEVKRLKLATIVKNENLAPEASLAEFTAMPFAALYKQKIEQNRNIKQNNKISMKIIDFIKTLAKVSEIKNLVVTSADGIDYTVTNEDGSEDLKVGSNVTIDGQPYDGEIIMADNAVITVENGVVTKIEKPEEETTPEPEPEVKEEVEVEDETPADNTDAIDSLRGKVDELYALLNDLTERVNTIEGQKSEVENAKAEVEELKNKIRNMVSTEQPNPVNQTGEEKKPVFGFKK